jgi:hypothetical protein
LVTADTLKRDEQFKWLKESVLFKQKSFWAKKIFESEISAGGLVTGPKITFAYNKF